MCMVWCDLSATPPHRLYSNALRINKCGTVADEMHDMKD